MKKLFLLFFPRKKSKLLTLFSLGVALLVSFDLSAVPKKTNSAGIENMQQVAINGSVADATSGEALAGVNVVVVGTTIGTTTDVSGKFTLTVPSASAVLRFSFIGYIPQEVPLGGRTTLSVALAAEMTGIDEVVIVGYGVQKKKTVTGSIFAISNAKLEKLPVTSISGALVGRVPGLFSIQTSGEPGLDAPILRIRGAASLSASGVQPLIIIDGVERTSGILNALDLKEIDNINVLKDASATAVYGVRGANGVIIVTTKRGQKGAPQVSFSSNLGISRLSYNIKSLESYEYSLFRNEAITMDNEPTFEKYRMTDDELWKFANNRDYTPAEVDAMANLTAEQKEALKNSPALYYTSHNWSDELLGNPGPLQQYNLNFSGGGDNVRYFTSVGYFNQEGNIKNATYGGNNVQSDYERYNFRSNYDIDVIKNLQMSVDVSGQIYSFSGITGRSGANRIKELLSAMVFNTPFSGPGIVDGKLVTGYVSNSTELQNKGGGGYSAIASILGHGTMSERTTNLNFNMKLKHTMDYITKGLSAHGSLSYDNSFLKGQTYTMSIPTYTAVRNPANPAEIIFYGGTPGQDAVDDFTSSNKWRRFYVEAGLDYNHTFGSHTVTGLLLYNAQKTFDPGLQYKVPAGLIGTVARVTYDYDGRYLAEFNMGYNGSENFPEGKRFGFFPAVSAGWNVSEEDFFPKDIFISRLKIRGSYGEVGNDRIGGNRYLYLPNAWQYGGTNNPTESYFFGSTNGSSKDPVYQGAWESAVGNPNVTWERARKSNIGFEMSLLKNRLSFTVDYFQEKRDNILWGLGTIPVLVAATLPPVNIGKVENHGYELTLGWMDDIGKVHYYVDTYLSYARNKIIYMDEPNNPYEWMNNTGFQLGQIKGYYAEGFYNSAAEASNRPYNTRDGNKAQAGDIRMVDVNGDGKLDTKDIVPIGFANFPQYSFNINGGASYKNFGLQVLFVGTQNGDILLGVDDSHFTNPFWESNSGAMDFQYYGRWTPEKAAAGITPTFPRASMRQFQSQNGVPNSLWLQSTDYMRLKNLELSYNIQNINFFKRLNISYVKIFVNGTNLYTFGKERLIDPEQAQSGQVEQGYLYPLTKVYNAGIEIKF